MSESMQTTKTTCDDWSLINNRDISNKYRITLRNKLNALQEISETLTLNGEYKDFVNTHLEAAAERILTKVRVKQSSMGDISS